MKRMMLACVVAIAAGITLSACERQKGPAEKMGEKIDEAAEAVTGRDENAVEKAGRKLDEAVEDARERIEEG